MSTQGAVADLMGGNNASAPRSSVPAEGQLSVSDAWTRRAELMRDPSFADRLKRNDQDAVAEQRRVTSGILSGMTIEAGDGVDAAALGPGVANAQAEREKLLLAQQADDLRSFGMINDDVAEFVRKRTPVTRTERHLVEQRKAQLFADPGWRTRFYQGDVTARSDMANIVASLSAPLAD
jgi:hypothetical protein